MEKETKQAARRAGGPSAGVERTLRALMKAIDPTADDLLLVAARSEDATLRVGAVRALVRRPSPHGHSALIAQWRELEPDARSTLLAEAERPAIVASLENEIASSDQKRSGNAIDFAETGAVVGAVPAIVKSALRTNDRKEKQRAANVALQLSAEIGSRLYTQSGAHESGRPDPAFSRRSAVLALIESLNRYDEHGLNTLIDALLEVVSGADETLLRTLQNPAHVGHPALIDRLQHADGAGVAVLLLALLNNPETPDAALNAIASRADTATLDHLHKPFSTRVSTTSRKNLQRIDGFGWLNEENLGEILTWHEDTLSGAVRIAAASSASRHELLWLVEFVLAAGAIEPSPAVGALARLAAAEAIDSLPSHLIARAMQLALDDQEPIVAAAAARLVRKKNLPGAERTLIKLLDHKHADVRKAAQGALKGFTYSNLRDFAEQLTEEEYSSLGKVVGKADPLALQQLTSELRAGAAPRRIVAIEMAETLGLVDDVDARLLQLIEDPDLGVRCEAARVLGLSTGSDEVVRALGERLKDPAIAVRSAAENSLKALGRFEDAIQLTTKELV